MSIRRSKCSVEFILEELGVTGINVHFSCMMSDNFPSEIEIDTIYVYKAHGETWAFSRSDRIDWFQFLDKCIRNYVFDRITDYEQMCAEGLG